MIKTNSEYIANGLCVYILKKRLYEKKILYYINKVSYHIDIELCLLSLFRNGINIISVKEPLLYQTYKISYNKSNLII